MRLSNRIRKGGGREEETKFQSTAERKRHGLGIAKGVRSTYLLLYDKTIKCKYIVNW